MFALHFYHCFTVLTVLFVLVLLVFVFKNNDPNDISLSETQVKELQETKEQTQTKLQNCRDKTAVLKAKQSELLKKIGEVGAEIASKSEIMSIS